MTTSDPPSGFPATRLSVVVRTRSRDEAERRIAFETLIDAYWKPIDTYLRLKWRLDPDEAADLTAATVNMDVAPVRRTRPPRESQR